MGLLGNTPEKRRYNKAILIIAASAIPLLCGVFLRSRFLMITGFIIIIVCSPILLIAKEEYYSFLFKKLRKKISRMQKKSKETQYEAMQQKIPEKSEPKESPLLPLIGGAIIAIVFGSLYFANRNAELYPAIFRSVATVGLLILAYGLYKYLRQKRD